MTPTEIKRQMKVFRENAARAEAARTPERLVAEIEREQRAREVRLYERIRRMA